MEVRGRVGALHHDSRAWPHRGWLVSCTVCPQARRFSSRMSAADFAAAFSRQVLSGIGHRHRRPGRRIARDDRVLHLVSDDRLNPRRRTRAIWRDDQLVQPPPDHPGRWAHRTVLPAFWIPFVIHSTFCGFSPKSGSSQSRSLAVTSAVVGIAAVCNVGAARIATHQICRWTIGLSIWVWLRRQSGCGHKRRVSRRSSDTDGLSLIPAPGKAPGTSHDPHAA